MKPPSDEKIIFDCEPDSSPEKSKRIIGDPKKSPPNGSNSDGEETDGSKTDVGHERKGPTKIKKRRSNTVKFDCDPDR
jgi:hypothetical protein